MINDIPIRGMTADEVRELVDGLKNERKFLLATISQEDALKHLHGIGIQKYKQSLEECEYRIKTIQSILARTGEK